MLSTTHGGVVFPTQSSIPYVELLLKGLDYKEFNITRLMPFFTVLEPWHSQDHVIIHTQNQTSYKHIHHKICMFISMHDLPLLSLQQLNTYGINAWEYE